jgi:general secretion pathway protein D
MKMKIKILALCRSVLIAALALHISACATYWTEKHAGRLIDEGRFGEGVKALQQLSVQAPHKYRARYVQERDRATQTLLRRADVARRQGKSAEALAAYREILEFDPLHADAVHGLELIARDQREATTLQQIDEALKQGDKDTARTLINSVLVENPAHREAKRLSHSLDLHQNRELLNEPVLRGAFKKPVSLEFRNASVQAIFEVLSQASGINFIFDKDVNADAKTTIFVHDTSVEDALRLILQTNQLSHKILNDSTLLIYPSTEAKEKQYLELITRTFYLGNAHPQKVQELVKTLINPKSIYVDEALKMLVVRDSLKVIESIEKLIGVYDLAAPEVTLEVEILEIGSDDLLNVGIQYPDQVRASVSGGAGKAGQLTIDELKNLNKDNFLLFVPDPVAILNLKQSSGKAKTLANPRIRVTNREKAKILVGDKVPVITTTVNQTSSASTESVSYLDVGLKLEVEPEIYVNNDVSIGINLEVSNIVKEIKSSTGLLTYQIGTRSANTVLRVHDGETQVLAGLIKDEQRDSASHLPGLGRLPVLGRLFSNETNAKSRSEIVLLITPHVVRSLATPAANMLEFHSGTGNEVASKPMRLASAAIRANLDKAAIAEREAKVGEGAASGDAAAMTVQMAADARAAPPSPLINRVDPALASVKLDMVAPAQIPVNKQFTLAVLAGSSGFEGMEFDIAIDQPGIELVKASSLVPVDNFEAEQRGQVIHIKVGRLSSAMSGPLAMITLQATQVTNSPATLVMHSARAFKANNILLTVATALPKQLLITP